MPAFQFDSTGIDPAYGGGSQLPIGKHPVVIVGSELKPTKDGQGGYMALTLEAIDGPAKGIQHVDRLNLHNKNAETVRIANQQLSAYCHVSGVFRFQATEELHGKPFVVEIGPDTRATNEGRTEVKKLFDINGNDPAKAGAGQPQGGGQGFGGASGGQGQGGGFQPGTGQGGQPQGGQPNGGGQPQGGGNQWGGGQPQGGGAAPQSGGGAWSQSGAGGGGQPGWGQR